MSSHTEEVERKDLHAKSEHLKIRFLLNSLDLSVTFNIYSQCLSVNMCMCVISYFNDSSPKYDLILSTLCCFA